MKWKGTVSHCEKITIDARLATVKTTQAASTQPGWKGQERPAGASGDPASGPRRALLMKGRPAGSGWRRLAGRGWRRPAERGWRRLAGRGWRRPAERGWRKPPGRGWRRPAERGWRKPPGRGPRRRLGAG